MSDDKKVTKGFKVRTETRDYIDRLYAGSEFSDQEDFLKHLGALHEMQQMKNGEVSGYAAQLDEMEFHSRRTVELFLAMIQTEQTGRVRMGEEHAEHIAELASELSTQQDEIRGLTEELKVEKAAGIELKKQIGEFEKHTQQLQQANERGEELIAEYKTRIDSLSALVADQQESVNHAKASEQRLTELLKLTESQAQEIERAREEKVKAVEESKRAQETQEAANAAALKQLRERHTYELQQQKERLELASDRAVVAEERKHSEEVRKLYDEVDKLRQELAEARIPKIVKEE